MVFGGEIFKEPSNSLVSLETLGHPTRARISHSSEASLEASANFLDNERVTSIGYFCNLTPPNRHLVTISINLLDIPNWHLKAIISSFPAKRDIWWPDFKHSTQQTSGGHSFKYSAQETSGGLFFNLRALLICSTTQRDTTWLQLNIFMPMLQLLLCI
jgi:hypothetical protein